MALHTITAKTWGVACDTCGLLSAFAPRRDAHLDSLGKQGWHIRMSPDFVRAEAACPCCATAQKKPAGFEFLLVPRTQAARRPSKADLVGGSR